MIEYQTFQVVLLAAVIILGAIIVLMDFKIPGGRA